jgi:hypothetical protein
VEGSLIALAHAGNLGYCLQSFELIFMIPQHVSELVWNSRIEWATVPGTAPLLTTALMVLPSAILITSMAAQNALIGSGSLLNLTLLS